MSNLRERQRQEINRLIPLKYATKAEAERALIDKGIEAVHLELGMKPLPIDKKVRA